MDNQLEGPLKRKGNGTPVHRNPDDMARNLFVQGSQDLKRMSDAPKASLNRL